MPRKHCKACIWSSFSVHGQIAVDIPKCSTADGSSVRVLAPWMIPKGVFFVTPPSASCPKVLWLSHSVLLFCFCFSPLSSIVNVPGEWTLRREFLRLQTEDRGGREGGREGGQQKQAGLEFSVDFVYIDLYWFIKENLTCRIIFSLYCFCHLLFFFWIVLKPNFKHFLHPTFQICCFYFSNVIVN